MQITSHISQLIHSHKAEGASSSHATQNSQFNEDNVRTLADAGKHAPKPNNLQQRSTAPNGEPLARHSTQADEQTTTDSNNRAPSPTKKSKKSFLSKLSCGLLINIGKQNKQNNTPNAQPHQSTLNTSTNSPIHRPPVSAETQTTSSTKNQDSFTNEPRLSRHALPDARPASTLLSIPEHGREDGEEDTFRQLNPKGTDRIREQLNQPLSSRFKLDSNAEGTSEKTKGVAQDNTEAKTPSKQREGKAPLHSPTHVQESVSTYHTGESSGVDKTTASGAKSKSTLAQLMRSDSTFKNEAAANKLRHVGLELNNQTLSVDAETAPEIRSILSQTLGRKKQKYVALETHQNGQQQFALDNKGKVFQVTSKADIGISALHTSRPVIDPNSPPDSIRDHLVNARANNVVDKSHLAELTGVYTDKNDNHWRVHDGNLYKAKSNLTGQTEWKKADENISSLIMSSDNQVYAIKDDRKIINVSTQQASANMPQDIISADVNAKNEVAFLLKADHRESQQGFLKTDDGSIVKQADSQYEGELRIRLKPQVDSSADMTLDLPARYGPSMSDKAGSKTDFTSIGFSDDQLFAIDSENKILIAKTPLRQEAAITFDANPQSALEDAFGTDIKYKRFSHFEDGNLAVTIKDKKGQNHLCALNSDGKTFSPGWNLSDSLVLDNTLGLEKTVDESSLQIQNFKKAGPLALNDKGELFAKDNLTNKWSKIDKNVSELTRGADNNPYVVQKGEVKRVLLQEESNKIAHGDDNVFAMTQRRNSYSLQSGLKKAPSEDIQSAAVLGSYKHVTLDKQGELTFRNVPHREAKSLISDVKVERGNIPEADGKVTSITVDKSKTLFALTEGGSLYSLPEEKWSKLDGGTSPEWSKESLPDSETDLSSAQLTLSKSLKLQINGPNGDQLIKSDSHWDKGDNTAENASETIRDKLFNIIEKSAKKYNVGKTGASVATSAEVGGFTGQQTTAIQTKFKDRLKAHIFKPGLDTPRPIKTMANSVQHNWQGRQGLQTTYQQASALFKELDALNVDIKTDPNKTSVTDSKTRIDQLNLGETGKGFKKDIESFREELENSALRQLIALGKSQGILKQDSVAEVNENYKPSKLKDFKQQFNPSRSGHDLTAELQTVWKQSPASENSKVNELLTAFSEKKLNMSHQALDVPLGRNRDQDDKMSLSKARLVLDTLTLQKVNGLIDSAELIAKGDASPEQVTSLSESLEKLKGEKYANNPVKMQTDSGVQSHRQAEANYDASKYLIKAMSSDDNALKILTKAALKSGDNQEFSSAFKDLMYTLKPEDNIALSRGYSGGVKAAFFPEPLVTPIFDTFMSASANEKRSYDMEFDGTEDGVAITIKGALGPSIKASLGVGRNYLPDLHKNDNLPIPINGDDKNFSPDARINASLTGGFDLSTLNEVKFTIKDENIDAFVNTLTKRNAKPDDLIELGIDHVTTQGSKWTFSLDASLNLAARARVNFINENPNASSMIRLGGGVTANSNIMTKSNETKHYAGSDTLKERSTLKESTLSKHSASASIALTAGTSINTGQGGIPVYNNLSASVDAVIDNSLKTRGEIKAKLVPATKDADVEKQTKALASVFPSAQHKPVLEAIKKESDIGKQLNLLEDHFLSNSVKVTNDDQHNAITKLKKAINQHAAHEAKVPMLAGNKVMLILGNSHNITSEELGQIIGSLIKPSVQRDAAKQIQELVKNDPIIEDMITSMQTRPLSGSYVTLELKDDIRDKAEKDYINGKLDVDAAKQLLEKPENRRLQSISVIESGEYSEGFSTPLPFVSASSSASIYMEKMSAAIKFEYGRDQDVPLSYKLAGDLVSAKSDMSEMIEELEKGSVAIKTGND
ncbi:AvrE-family type 3 secretion system effector [Marinomonas mediterranea]|uniref:Uncharacterized protein n=1 Tax=Marinomonas mediterranea (strain ATCC 700492 / JCM 21426 / NBRC 103028 / MMB-1) TaxID=717774 RepID=F2JTB6_MARM1|nr:AvrE-family type 3 secretion system effector [Marinomonas mediterranea]ADZ90334.1 hypothetical protein Marme_1059 [Marinomonas mediterranea MMB-1]WCN16520.1 AvrE-family type 3 secretion system effector [Marinomonas mediterranea MMB-1]